MEYGSNLDSRLILGRVTHVRPHDVSPSEPPQNMTLAVASSVTENTKMSLECTVHAANPAPSILWCVGAEPCTLCTETDVTRAAGRYSVTARRTVTLQRTADNSPVTVTCRAANPRNVSDTWRAERAMIDVQCEWVEFWFD